MLMSPQGGTVLASLTQYDVKDTRDEGVGHGSRKEGEEPVCKGKGGEGSQNLGLATSSTPAEPPESARQPILQDAADVGALAAALREAPALGTVMALQEGHPGRGPCGRFCFSSRDARAKQGCRGRAGMHGLNRDARVRSAAHLLRTSSEGPSTHDERGHAEMSHVGSGCAMPGLHRGLTGLLGRARAPPRVWSLAARRTPSLARSSCPGSAHRLHLLVLEVLTGLISLSWKC